MSDIDAKIDKLAETADVKPVAAAKPVDVAPAAPAKEPAAPAADQDAPEADENQEGEEARTPWPKTAENAVKRRDKKLNKLNESVRDYSQKLNDPKFLKDQLAKLEGGKIAAPAANPADPEPELAKYDDWGKYNKDLTAWNVRQLEAAKAASVKVETPESKEHTAWVAQRTDVAVNQVKELVTQNPEFLHVFQQNADVIDDFPDTVKNALLKSDNAALATIVLAQEGSLEDLGEMSQALAEKVIAQAIIRGQKFIKQSEDAGEEATMQAPPPALKKVSAAPAPMTPSKTVVAGKKSADKMSDAEFRKEFLG